MSVLERHPLSDDEGLDHDEAHDTISDDMPSLLPVPTNRGRRVSVSAESIQPSLHPTKEDYVCHPKTDQQRESINAAIANNFLFKCLDDDQRARVIDTMAEKRVKKGDVVIKQGDEGDYYYVVESGTFDCFLEQKDGPAVKATSYGPCGSFGELALMYNAPRAATIVATSDGLLWALDRMTFRSILMDSTAKKRRMYEQFLTEVPILKSLELYERHKIADALEPVQFDDQDVVMAEGDVGENFYLIEDGEAVVYQNVDGQRKEVNRLKKGDYFGELALLHDRPRAATVIAKGKLKCVTLGKKAFTRLLGPVMDILKRNSENYHAILQEASKEP